MYRTCPSLEKYWRDIFKTLSSVLQYGIPRTLALVGLFGTTGEDDKHLTLTNCRSLSFASFLARRVILLRWEDVAPPTQAQCLCLV